jgi:hypothetical protein
MPAPYWTPKPDRFLKATREVDLVEINSILNQIHADGGLSTISEDQPEMFAYANPDGRF